MKIYSMTATFGKLNHKTLMLKPGMNVIQAPNEWGKSTWCAFLGAMLYGLDTRAKSTKTALADKDHYAPWSGAPMEGRMDICWKGRNITIERSTRGRIPLGSFRAYETESGLEVPELNAGNCGQMLLGVEKSVFLRSGFIRFADMPVSQDEALRAKLNALVTTGDESGTGEKLAKQLKELKNRCRYHKTGLLPQAEAELASLEEQLSQLESLEARCNDLIIRQQENRAWTEKLENHRLALEYEAAQEDVRQVRQARAQYEDALARIVRLETDCRDLPKQEQLENALKTAAYLESEAVALVEESRMLQEEPRAVEVPAFVQGMEPETVVSRAEADGIAYRALRRVHPLMVFFLLAAAAGGAVGLWYGVPKLWIVAGCATMLAALLIWGLIRWNKAGKIAKIYGNTDPDLWIRAAREYARQQVSYREQTAQLAVRREELAGRWEMHRTKIWNLTKGESLAECRANWESGLRCRTLLAEARKDCEQAQRYWNTVRAMARPIPAAPEGDTLTLDEEETASALEESRRTQLRLENLRSQYTGRMEAMGDKQLLRKQLADTRERIRRLEETYGALTLAQETLAKATTQLQRRFAPRITEGARKRMAILTDGRYDRLQLGVDLHLHAGAAGEDTLHDAIWRSDGTADQLYLALRLAVAEALTPDAPLVLDDALVRFDDTRLAAAMKLLQEEAERRQVILFTCQSREQNLLM